MSPRPLAIFGATILIALVIDLVADRASVLIDLTSERSLSLTDQTKTLAGAVRKNTTVTLFLPPDDPERAASAALLLRYRRLNRRINYRILDPQRAVGEQRRLGVDPIFGGAAVAQGDNVELIPTITEQDVTGALARLARGRSAEICVSAGHGESDIGDGGPQGLQSAARLLEQNGYRVRSIDLLANTTVPDSCNGVVVANPTAPLDGAGASLAGWLDADGRLLVLADPVSQVDFSEILTSYQLGLRRGIVLEGDAESALEGDPTAPIVHTYSSANPIVRRLPPTFFPGVEQVVVGKSDEANGLTVNRLADTSAISYLETEPLTGEFDPAVDRPGPITVAGSADRSRLTGETIHRSRVVVVGDVDFATNAVLDQAANSTFLVRSLDWLTLDDQLVVLSANLPRDRRLSMTAARVRYARYVSLVLLPGLFLLAGAAVWALRRAR